MLTKSIIKIKAFSLFRTWSKRVELNQSNMKIAIFDEMILVNNLTEAIQNALIALMDDNKKEKRQKNGFDIGFVSGFICSQLNTTWYYEYILKQTDEYKQFIAFKALKIYIEFDKLSEIRISAIYKNLIENDNNLLERNQDIEHKSILNEKLNKLADIPQVEILKAINNQINSYINNYLTRSSPDYLESISSHFSDEELLNIINNNIEK